MPPLPPPSPSASPPPPPPLPPAVAAVMPAGSTLGDHINAATRKQHTALNRLLVKRLPLALPPYQKNPLLFSRGLLVFARIYFFFELEWELLARHEQQRTSADVSHEDHVRTWLANLRPHSLPRSPRLKNDVQHLRDVVGPSMYSTPELDDKWIQDMRTCIRSQPHTLLAFAWVFYMATFAGGRWIRQQLSNGGAEFWTGQTLDQELRNGEKAPLEILGFSFLSFDSPSDGEDIKASFKARLAEAEVLLTAKEMDEVIAVARRLFDRCNSLVGELDRMVLRERTLNWLPFGLSILLIVALWAVWRHPISGPELFGVATG